MSTAISSSLSSAPSSIIDAITERQPAASSPPWAVTSSSSWHSTHFFWSRASPAASSTASALTSASCIASTTASLRAISSRLSSRRLFADFWMSGVIATRYAVT